MDNKKALKHLIKSLAAIGDELRALRRAVDRLESHSKGYATDVYGHHGMFESASWSHHGPVAESSKYGHHGHSVSVQLAVWVFSSGKWQLDRNSLPAGSRPGPPPNIRGSYEGQCVKTECRD